MVTKKYVNVTRFCIVLSLAIFLGICGISLAIAQEITVAECASCHEDVSFNVGSVDRTSTCKNCHMAPKDHPNGENGLGDVSTPNGYFSSVAASNATAPTVHIVHADKYPGTVPNPGFEKSCADCHWGWSKGARDLNAYVDVRSCDRCHNATTEVFHSEHGNVTTVYSCESDLCHAKTVTAESPYVWNISQPQPACENCHNDQISISRHDVIVSHTTTEGSGCMNCHSNQYLPDLHNNVDDFDTNCSVCHNNELIPTLPDTIECQECHGGATLFPVHKNRDNNPSSYDESTSMSGRSSR